jgi:acetyl-CoA C-acetyltransferase
MVDPRTPVLVGVGQFTERIDDADYRGMSAVELATEAARAALADTGADPAKVASAVDTVYGLRQFEISGPMPATLGKSNNYPRSVMNRLGGDPARVVLEPVGGQGPQKLVTEAGNTIVAGDADVVMIMGSEPGSTARYFANRDDKPDFTEHVDGQLEDRGHQMFTYIDDYTIQHGLTGSPRCRKWLQRTRFRHRRWSDRLTRSSPSPKTTGWSATPIPACSSHVIRSTRAQRRS